MNPDQPAPPNHIQETINSLDGLIQALREQIQAEPPKPSIPDWVRLVQLRLDLAKEYLLVPQGPIHVHWVDDETLPEPDPDPTVPWAGDEPLS